MQADSLTLRTLAENIAAQVPPGRGQPCLEESPDKTSALLAALTEGNYRVTACRVAGIGETTLASMFKRAAAGNVAAIALSEAIEKAEALAERQVVAKWRNAIDAGPQYWAAAATFLERKSPDRWGRRQEDSGTPRVLVQIGASGADVTVHVSASGSHAANITDASSSPIDVTPVDTTDTAIVPTVHKVHYQTLTQGVSGLVDAQRQGETTQPADGGVRRANRGETLPGTGGGHAPAQRQSRQRVTSPRTGAAKKKGIAG